MNEKDEKEKTNGIDTPTFNSSKAYSEELHELFKEGTREAIRNNIPAWREILKGIARMLSFYLKKQTIEVEGNTITKKEYVFLVLNNVDYVPKPRTVRREIKNYRANEPLAEIEMFLRESAFEAGLINAKQDNPEMAMFS